MEEERQFSERFDRRFESTDQGGLAERSATDHRSPARRDRDRILYSSAFRRLGGITQVASPTELQPVHNRLIHSLKVAQVGRGLADQLLTDPLHSTAIDHIGGVDPDVVEAAALAHDLGHPPFGHVAEETLDLLLVDGKSGSAVSDGYNGNAQSFRIITKLAVRHPAREDQDLAGLNLSRATLNAVLKYPWIRGNRGHQHQKWGVYESETDDFVWARQHASPVLEGKTAEAALMDWADDITYAVHDVEDFFRAGLIPLDRLTSDSREQERFRRRTVESGKVTSDESDAILQVLLNSLVVKPGVLAPFSGSRSDRAALRNLTSQLINRYVSQSLTIRQHGNQVTLSIDPELEREVRVLKLLTWCYVIDSLSLITQRYGQRTLITSLFNTFCDAAHTRSDRRIFPDFFQEALDITDGSDAQVKRIVADLISSMSEAQAIATHQRLSGQSLGSAMDAYLQ